MTLVSPLVYLAGGWLFGIVAAALGLPGPLAALLAGAWAAALLWRRPAPRTALLPDAGIVAGWAHRRGQPPTLLVLGALALALLGVLRYQDSLPSESASGLAVYNDQGALRMRGVVIDDGQEEGRALRLRLAVRQVLREGRWRPAAGKALMTTSAAAPYRYGDLLEVQGELRTPPTLPSLPSPPGPGLPRSGMALPGFDYREYLARQGIGSIIYYPHVRRLAEGEGNPFFEALFGVRRWLAGGLRAALPEPQASLGQAILLGMRRSLPPDLTQDFNATGLSHLVVVSGQNVTLVAGLVLSGLLWLLGRRWATVAAMAGVIVYALLAGAEPPVQRGAIMGLLFLLATLLGRQSSAHVALVAAAATMVGLNPPLVGDISFQLSFAATAGLVLLAPLLLRLLGGGRGRPRGLPLLAGLGGLLATTLAAIAFTQPLIALYFGRLSLVAPLANLLVVPLFPILMVTAGLAALAGAVAAPLGEPLGWLAWGPLSYMMGVAHLGAGLPLASLSLKGFGPLQAALAYSLLLAGVVYLHRHHYSLQVPLPRFQPPRPSSRRLAVAIPLLALAALGVWVPIVGLGPGQERLKVTFLDVGQGDAILIESPGGRRVLVDGGPSGQALLTALGSRLPIWDRRLDLAVLTHPQEDHLVGLVAALDRYRVGAAMDNGGRAESEAFLAYQRLIEQKGIRHWQAQAGQRVDLGGGARLEVLHPGSGHEEDINNSSVVLRLSLGQVAFLLTGDLEEEGEMALLQGGRPLKATVLKVPHHGSATSSSPPFLAAVRPALAVISAGRENSYGHPAPLTLQRLEAARELVLRTDRQGTIEISTDGRRLWVRSRQPLCQRTPGCR